MTVPPANARRITFSTLLAVALACLVLLPLLGHKPLVEWDEAIYAEISREMLGHSWLVPTWNGQLWFEKPPLLFWITATFYRVFGVTEFWARAASVFSGVAIVGLLHDWLYRYRNQFSAWLCTLILLATFGFLHVTRLGEMDVLLSLGCCIALCGLSAMQRQSRAGWYLFWIGFAIAWMTKGAGSITLLLTLFVLAFVSRWSPHLFNRSFWLGFAGFLVIVLPWHLYLASRFGATFIGEYLGFHVLARATHQIEGHVTHWWYYLAVLLFSAAPFVLIYPAAVWRALRDPVLRVWAIFAVISLIFFTIVQTRLPHYIAPMYPVLSLLTAVFLDERIQPLVAQRRPASFWIKAATAVIALFAISIPLTAPGRRWLHSKKAADGTILPESREHVALLRTVFPRSETGPLLLWQAHPGDSISTRIFYAKRPVERVELQPIASDDANRYLPKAVPLESAVTAMPQLILIDSELVGQLPHDLSYQRIEASKSMEIGTIARRP